MLTADQVKDKIEKRFCDRVKFGEPDECWIWQRGLNKGYGAFYVGKNNKPAHRYIFTELFGNLETVIEVCHSCDTPACVNPNHLFAGTRKDNVDDMIRKGRKAPNFGEHSPRAKLTDDKVRIIRMRIAVGEEHKSIAKSFGVRESLISRINTGVRWKHVV